MNILKWALLTGLAAALSAPFCRPVVAQGFVDVLDSPAQSSHLAQHGLLVGLAGAGERLVAVGQRGHILYSDDGGERWQQASVPVSSDLVAVHFPSASHGWAVGHDGVVLHSADGGASWQRQFDGRQVGPSMLSHYRELARAAPDDQSLAALLHEAERMTAEGADKPFLDVWFENERQGYIVGAFNLIFRTEDGGRSWTPWMERTDNPSALNLYAIRPAAGELFIAGEQGLLLRLDRASGRFVPSPTSYAGSFFGILGTPDAALVYGLRGNVFRSVDGGASWNQVEIGLPVSITSATRFADGRLALLSQAGHLLLSSDNGASFQLQPQPAMAPVAAAQAATHGALVLAGTRGVRRLLVE
ncbi:MULTISPECIES: YCF48-related protein [unclassified Pseudomonas]|uniref:WD40/YVTN/BNR-like repeat-containing protein n=1 Tax=unclassified Pseudomonas TaxID=196821 RepID=UPI00244922E3|nr:MULTISPECIES: YCF48-related protein [unclassified Pseudomonas]MDG9924432.1 YCF48-related protein [Pseudomonas sp. GD04045]MDH0035228.1 YCF48-related protein [Pseudomonas sp. GD04019]